MKKFLVGKMYVWKPSSKPTKDLNNPHFTVYEGDRDKIWSISASNYMLPIDEPVVILERHNGTDCYDVRILLINGGTGWIRVGKEFAIDWVSF
jgi:hypothetical protein